MKNGSFALNAITKPPGVESYRLWIFVYATEEKKNLVSGFNFELLHIKVSSPCENR